MEQNNFINFGRGSPKEHFCEIILKSGHWPKRRCHLKKLFMDGWTEDRKMSITIAYLENFVLESPAQSSEMTYHICHNKYTMGLESPFLPLKLSLVSHTIKCTMMNGPKRNCGNLPHKYSQLVFTSQILGENHIVSKQVNLNSTE